MQRNGRLGGRFAFRAMEKNPPAPAAAVRLDLWLWAARFFKTRTLAKAAIEGGKVDVNGHVTNKPAKSLHVGDRVVVQRGEERIEVTVLVLGDVRGSAAVAQSLYAESPDSRARREAEAAKRRDERQGFQPPDTKPDKRARRLLRASGASSARSRCRASARRRSTSRRSPARSST
jgi:ribosome-associated heat shock protein Hsp15